MIWARGEENDAVVKRQMHGVLSLPVVSVVVVMYSERSAQFWDAYVQPILKSRVVVFPRQGMSIQFSHTFGKMIDFVQDMDGSYHQLHRCRYVTYLFRT